MMNIHAKFHSNSCTPLSTEISRHGRTHAILARSRDSARRRSLRRSLLFRGCPSLTYSFSVIYANIAVNYILPKTRFFALHFFRRWVGGWMYACWSNIDFQQGVYV